MIRILVADDDKVQLEQIRVEVCKWKDNSDVKAVIKTFSSGQDLINYCFMSDDVVDIVLLDMKMDGMDGLATGARIREKYSNCVIIYVTNYLEYAIDAFHVNAHRYIIKDKLHDELVEALNSAIVKFNETPTYFAYKKHKQEFCLLCSNILYFESLRREIRIYTTGDSNISFYGKISDIADKVDNKIFRRCHQSYIVNMDYIQEVSKKEIKMKNGDIVPVSSKYVHDVTEALVWREK